MKGAVSIDVFRSAPKSHFISLNRARQKQSSLWRPLALAAGQYLTCHWHPAYVYKTHVQISCGGCGAGMFFSFQALFKFFGFYKIGWIHFIQQGTIPAACERTAKVGISAGIMKKIGNFQRNWMDIDHNLERQTGGTDPRTVKRLAWASKSEVSPVV